MTVRTKGKFHNKSRPKTLEEIAGAVGMTAWKLAQTTTNRMYSDGFNFSSNEQILNVISEFLAFIIQLTDRLSYDKMSDEQRQRFVGALAKHLIRTWIENMQIEVGEGEHQAAIIDTLNQRMEAYAEFGFSDGEPSYHARRYFGSCVDAVMGGENNKWVIEQIVDVESPVVIKTLKKNLDDLLAQSELYAQAG